MWLIGDGLGCFVPLLLLGLLFRVVVSADEDEVDCHADADGGQDEAKDDGVAGDAAGLPGAGAELMDELDMAEDGAESDDDAKGYEAYSRPEGEAGGAGGDVGVGGGDLAEEEAEAADGEAYAHEAEACADPSEEGSLGGEVDSGVLFGGLFG
jgi:hypothetical protein